MPENKEQTSPSGRRRQPPTKTQVERKLPWKQLTILCLVRFSEPIALTSVFPYQPEMIQSFPGIRPADVGFWTGVSSTVFSTAQCFTAIQWGKASDKYGRKWIILIGLFNTMVASVLWGLSTNLTMALLVRALSGAVNGNVGVIRTVVAEHCPWKELQPRAFSLMPLVFNIGSIIGPALGGALANPLHRPSSDRSPGPFLWRFPYALPNLVAASVFLVGIFIGIFFLEETHEVMKNRRDPFLRFGDRTAALCRKIWAKTKSLVTRKEVEVQVGEETEYAALASYPEQYDDDMDEEQGVNNGTEKQTTRLVSKTPSVKEVLTRDTILFLIAYTSLAMHNTAFDQIISVYMHHSRTGPEIIPDKSWFRFNKGFGMDPSTAGMFFTVNGIGGIILQIFLFTPLTKRFGSLAVLRVCVVVLPLLYAIIPFTTLIEPQWLRHTMMLSIWMLKNIAAIFAFPCCTILVTNSAKSLRHLGTVNGITTSLGAVGRATGPMAVGYAFTWGVHHGLLIVPFWLNSLICIISWYPLFVAKEGAGFGEDPPEDLELESSSADEEDGWADDESNTKQRKKSGKRKSTEKDGETLKSNMVEDVMVSASEDEGDDDPNKGLLKPDSGKFPTTRLGRTGELRPSVGRRRSATPIGTGEGFGSLSANLGVSRSGWGSGSEL